MFPFYMILPCFPFTRYYHVSLLPDITMFPQGEVEQIAMMKPKGQSEHDDGMLEFLEDIIGSNRFKEPIEVLAKRVETLNEFRGEKVRESFCVTCERCLL